jgi:hypothetical protein
VPLSDRRRADSVIAAVYGLYRDSVIAAQLNAGRDPRDWTWGRDGNKWGWDTAGIRLGKITIPNLVFAGLKVPIQGRNTNSITDARVAAWTQRELQLHANSMSQDDFKAAVKRIRDRVDREKRQQEQAAAKKPPTASPPPD